MKKRKINSVSHVFEKHYVSDELAESTKASMRGAFKRWEEYTGSPSVQSITNETVAVFREKAIEAGLAPTTINTIWRQVRSVLRRVGPVTDGNPWALGWISHVPAMKPVKVPFKRPVRLDFEEIDRIYIAARHMRVPRFNTPNPGYWWQAAIVLAYFTGLRVSDLIKAKWSDLNESESTLYVKVQKTGVEADLPLPAVVMDHLARLDRRHEEIFHIEPEKFQDYVRRLKKLATVEDFKGFHDIRRTACSECDRVRPGMGKVLLLHAPSSVTERSYLNSLEELRESVEAMRSPTSFRHGPKMAERALKEARKIIVQTRPKDFTVPVSPDPSLFQFTGGGFTFMGKFYRAAPARIRILKPLVTNGGQCSQLELWKACEKRAFPKRRTGRARLWNKISYCRLFLQKVFHLPEGMNPIVQTTVDDPKYGCNYALLLPPALWQPELKGGAA